MKEDFEKWLEVILVGNIEAKFSLNLKPVILQVLALALMLSDEHKLLKIKGQWPYRRAGIHGQ